MKNLFIALVAIVTLGIAANAEARGRVVLEGMSNVGEKIVISQIDQENFLVEFFYANGRAGMAGDGYGKVTSTSVDLRHEVYSGGDMDSPGESREEAFASGPLNKVYVFGKFFNCL